jgi:hypothetical protein
MADLLDTFLTGVPNTPSGTPQIFGSNAVSQSAARGIVSNRLARTTYLADAKAKLGEFRDRETARAQGQAALGQLTGLDPVNDPDYLNKVQGIIARNPGATLDATVNNFLKIQGDAFNRSDKFRQDEAEERRLQQLQDERDRRELELSNERTRSELGIRREAAVQNEIESLPPGLMSRFTEYRDSGMDQTRALAAVKEDAETAGALSELADLGISPDDDEVRMIPDPNNPKVMLSTGIFDKQGRIDPVKVNRIKAQARAEQIKSKEEESLRKDAMSSLRYIQRELENQLISPERKDQLEAAAAKYSELAGIEAPLTEAPKSGNVTPAKGAPVTQGTTKLAPPPDTSRTDRFLPR